MKERQGEWSSPLISIILPQWPYAYDHMLILLNKYLEAPNKEIKNASKYQQKWNRNSDRPGNDKKKKKKGSLT